MIKRRKKVFLFSHFFNILVLADELNVEIKDHNHHPSSTLTSPITPSHNATLEKFSSESIESSQSIEVVEEKYGDTDASEAADVVEELKPAIKVHIKATGDGPATTETLRRNTLSAPPPSASGKSKRLTISNDAPSKEKGANQKFSSMSIEENSEIVIPTHAAPISFAAINGPVPISAKTSSADFVSASSKLPPINEESEHINRDITANKIESVDMFATELIHAKLEGGKVTEFSLIGEISISIKESALKDSDLLFYCRLDNLANVHNLIVNPKVS